ncbi:MAG: hypothetical protein A3K09_03665 [Nitrospinae bacterium RIFCSPLOWO2_12_FULL_47_7]|nr:MAG: hypothetical protein A3K09_03665 [Nitrospinae bacterium RIFCSPLOWO2_12_FULL_47_7]
MFFYKMALSWHTINIDKYLYHRAIEPCYVKENQIKNITELTDREIFGLAIRIERQGALFYTALAEHIVDPENRDFILGMAREEGHHVKNIEKMLRNKGSAKYGWENEKSILDLIEKQFNTDIFPSLDEIFKQLPRFEGIEKAFNFAIESEKVSAEFYSLLGEYCDNFEAKILLLTLEKTERDHLKQVELLKKQCLEESGNK